MKKKVDGKHPKTWGSVDGGAKSKLPEARPKSPTTGRRNRSRRNAVQRRSKKRVMKRDGVKPSKPRRGRALSTTEAPHKNQAAKSLYDLLGGREGVLDLVRDLPTSQDNLHLNSLRDILSNDEMMGKRIDGVMRMSFGAMLLTSGTTEREIYQLFLDRKRAETLVTLANAEPKLAAEVVHSASSKYLPCRECGGTKIIYLEINGEEATRECNQCDKYGMEVVEGSLKHQELFFDLTKLKQVPTTQITTSVDNRSVSFTVGQPGTAPTPLSMIKSLDRIKDQGPRPVTVPMLNAPTTAPVVEVKEAEVVNR